MSQLTTNTATIDELITIANNLPDAGSGGEDVTDETTEYTNLLDDLEDAVNALPDAGGTSVETCTVTFINFDSSNLMVFGTMVLDDGTIKAATYDRFEDGRSVKFVKHSPLLVMDFDRWRLEYNTLAITSNCPLRVDILNDAVFPGASYTVLDADIVTIEFVG